MPKRLTGCFCHATKKVLGDCVLRAIGPFQRLACCLDVVDGCCCPHYDGEVDRRPSVHQFIKDEKIESCYALEDGAALHFKDNKLYSGIAFYKDATIYNVTMNAGEVIENQIKTLDLY